MYQPKTGNKCSCRRGVQRDNCPNCEGTGMVIDFAAIRARVQANSEDRKSGASLRDNNGNSAEQE